MAAKKTKRAPRQVWLLQHIRTDGVRGPFATKAAAKATKDFLEVIVGPYVLAERAGQR